jgi:hypothetical protein
VHRGAGALIHAEIEENARLAPGVTEAKIARMSTASEERDTPEANHRVGEYLRTPADRRPDFHGGFYDIRRPTGTR